MIIEYFNISFVGMIYSLGIRKRVIQSISSSKAPCNEYTRRVCIQRYIFQHYNNKYGCKIVFNSNAQYLKDFNPQQIPYCNVSIHSEFDKGFSKMTEYGRDKCPGIQSCHQTRYSFDLREQNIGLTGMNGTNENTIIRIALRDPIVEYNIDYISYDLQSLIGEVGGTLGLTIGLSFFSFAEWIIGLINYLTRQM